MASLKTQDLGTKKTHTACRNDTSLTHLIHPATALRPLGRMKPRVTLSYIAAATPPAGAAIGIL